MESNQGASHPHSAFPVQKYLGINSTQEGSRCPCKIWLWKRKILDSKKPSNKHVGGGPNTRTISYSMISQILWRIMWTLGERRLQVLTLLVILTENSENSWHVLNWSSFLKVKEIWWEVLVGEYPDIAPIWWEGTKPLKKMKENKVLRLWV